MHQFLHSNAHLFLNNIQYIVFVYLQSTWAWSNREKDLGICSTCAFIVQETNLKERVYNIFIYTTHGQGSMDLFTLAHKLKRTKFTKPKSACIFFYVETSSLSLIWTK